MSDADRHRRAKDLFLAALDAPPEERAALVVAEARGDAQLASDVRSLLAHHVEDDDLIEERAPAAPSVAGDGADPLGLIGQLLDDRYQVQALVAEGGFGLVYRAEQVRWRRPVAIKVFKLDDAHDEAIREAFIKEGAILSELSRKTTTIVQSYDIGAWRDRSGAPHLYTALEWLDGETLGDLMRWTDGGAPWSMARVLDTLDEVARGLGVAHDSGVAHRDVKPGNIFLLEGGGAKLLDFGIAKVAAEHEQGFKETGGAIRAFTISYGAPEQLTREVGATGPWTDVFSLALICTELLLGRRVGDDDDPRATLALLNDTERRPTPRRLGAPITREVERVFERALAFKPEDRFPDARAFWTALSAAHQAAPRRMALVPMVLAVVVVAVGLGLAWLATR